MKERDIEMDREKDKARDSEKRPASLSYDPPPKISSSQQTPPPSGKSLSPTTHDLSVQD
jgi:hypothetical protein